jgi:hypothetical protein
MLHNYHIFLILSHKCSVVINTHFKGMRQRAGRSNYKFWSVLPIHTFSSHWPNCVCWFMPVRKHQKSQTAGQHSCFVHWRSCVQISDINKLYWLIPHTLPHAIQANTSIVSDINSQLLPSITFLIHYSLTIPSLHTTLSDPLKVLLYNRPTELVAC